MDVVRTAAKQKEKPKIPLSSASNYQPIRSKENSEAPNFLSKIDLTVAVCVDSDDSDSDTEGELSESASPKSKDEFIAPSISNSSVNSQDEYRKSVSQKSSSDCVICTAAVPDAVITVCGHLAVCMDCGKKIHQCPVCRALFNENQLLKIYPV